MSSFFLILLLLFLYFFLIRPALRVWRSVRRAQQQQQDFINELFGTGRHAGRRPEAQDPEPSRRRGGWSSPRPRRRKIDPDVAETVRFTEVKESATQTVSEDGKSTRTSYTAESQVEDITWTDLP